MVTDADGLTCENVQDLVVMNLDTRETYPARCRQNTCRYCLPRNARRRGWAMALAQPERMMTLTLVAGRGDQVPMAVARIRLKRARQWLTRQGIDPGEWCWTVEPNPRETGYHAHVVQRGKYIPQRQLEKAMVAGGAGKCPRIEWVRDRSRGLKYNLKGYGAAGYGLKAFRADDAAVEALRINGGRLEHHTRGFYTVNGQTVPVREAERLAVEELFPGNGDRYVVCSSQLAETYLSDPARFPRIRWAPLLSELRK